MEQRGLESEELAEYQALSRHREANFWQQDGVSVEEALSGIKRQRKQRLIEILEQRGMSRNESAIFLMVVERDHPGLLSDQD
jgi:glucan phosphorylase